MRTCTKCKLKKKDTEFYVEKRYKNGRWSICKKCRAEYAKNYQKTESYKEYRKSSKYINYKKEYSSSEKQKEYRKKYRSTEKYKEAQRVYRKNRRASDIKFKLITSIRTRLNTAMRGLYKSGSAVHDLGCSIEELKTFLEKKFQPGMSWDNHGKWHIDHKIPLASFNLSDRKQFMKAVNYKNLQPLWAKDNIVKSNKLIK